MICRMAMIDFGSLWENVATDCPIAICRVVTMMHRTKAPSDEGAVSEADWGREKSRSLQHFSLPPPLRGASLIRGRQGAPAPVR